MFNYVDFLVLVIGVLLYFFSGKQKPELIGAIMFGAGLLAFLLAAEQIAFKWQ